MRKITIPIRTFSTSVLLILSTLLGILSGPNIPIAAATQPEKFSVTGNMTVPRTEHTATLLPNGKVLVVGGYNLSPSGTSIQYLTSAELYNPTTGTFSSTGGMTTKRAGHTATLLPNGKVLIAGGGNETGNLASAELYDPTTGSFSPTGSMNSASIDHTATLLTNGKVLIAGGFCSTASIDFCLIPPTNSFARIPADLYDPVTGTFSITGSMITPRFSHTATLIPNGKVLITGGTNSYAHFSSAELYDTNTETFSSTGNMSLTRRDHTSTLLGTGQVLITGGNALVGNQEIFTDSTELFLPNQGIFVPRPSMKTGRAFHSTTLLQNGNILVAGGGNETGELASAELNHPPGGFTSAGDMLNPRLRYTSTLLPNGQVLIAGGRTIGIDQYLKSAELYNP